MLVLARPETHSQASDEPTAEESDYDDLPMLVANGTPSDDESDEDDMSPRDTSDTCDTSDAAAPINVPRAHVPENNGDGSETEETSIIENATPATAATESGDDDDTPSQAQSEVESRGSGAYAFHRETNGELRPIELRPGPRQQRVGGETNVLREHDSAPEAIVIQLSADDAAYREVIQPSATIGATETPIEYLPSSCEEVLNSYCRTGTESQVMRQLCLEIITVTDDERWDEYLLSMRDEHSNVVLWYPLRAVEVAEIYLALQRHIWDFGAPRIVRSDPRGELSPEVMAEIIILAETGLNILIVYSTI